MVRKKTLGVEPDGALGRVGQIDARAVRVADEKFADMLREPRGSRSGPTGADGPTLDLYRHPRNPQPKADKSLGQSNMTDAEKKRDKALNEAMSYQSKGEKGFLASAIGGFAQGFTGGLAANAAFKKSQEGALPDAAQESPETQVEVPETPGVPEAQAEGPTIEPKHRGLARMAKEELASEGKSDVRSQDAGLLKRADAHEHEEEMDMDR